MRQVSEKTTEIHSRMRVEKEFNFQQAYIMFSDMVGYTKMIEKDLKKALKLLALNKDLHKSTIETYQGKMIKEMGDGILASFPSATAAINCAWQLQKDARKIKHLQLRIGIHMGEVIFCNNDVFGFAVNVAFRMQEMAHEGQILVSEAVINDLKTKPDINIKLLGYKKLKNVRNRIKTYAIECATNKVPTTHDLTLATLFFQIRKSLSMAWPIPN